MDPYLTDVLACPRCGPSFGLVLRADVMERGRVRRGSLGCPNCRDVFPIENGFADLRAPPRGDLGPGLAGSKSGEAPPAGLVPLALAALLGLENPNPSTVALIGNATALGVELASIVPACAVVGIDDALRLWPFSQFWSRMTTGPALSFRSLALRGVAVDGRLGVPWAREALRVSAPGAKVVVTNADRPATGMRRWLSSLGAELHLDGRVAVTEVSRPSLP